MNLWPAALMGSNLGGLSLFSLNQLELKRQFSFLQDVCGLLKHASRLVPHSQEHLVIKFCQLVHHLLNQLKVPTLLLPFLLLLLRFLPSHWLSSALPSGHHGRADAGRVGEVHHRSAQSVQRLDSLGHPAGSLGDSLWKWTSVLPGCCLRTELWCVLSASASN